tara:strand:- start:2526 stop:2639 length:114 start_codon:yes stop_codon:yes gene_type:complete
MGLSTFFEDPSICNMLDALAINGKVKMLMANTKVAAG